MTLPFDRPEALALNEARMSRVKSLGIIQPGMRVLDIGAGIGHLSKYLLDWGCEVVALEGRKTNVEEARRRYPGLDIRVCDVEKSFPVFIVAFDVALIFGALYHFRDPDSAFGHIQFTARPSFILLSTVVTDTQQLKKFQVLENNNVDQALNGLGCRPSLSYIEEYLIYRLGYHSIENISQPEHPDYQWTPQNDGQWRRDGKLLRRFFIFERSK
jgi:SAM-dependent methyltransferase